MIENTDFIPVFCDLRKILTPYANLLVLEKDTDDEFYLNTRFVMKNRKPMYFGSVKTLKNYVIFHLMPIYVFPELLAGISPSLKRRMQGKLCFNFKSLNDTLFSEIAVLTESEYSTYKKTGYL